VDEETLENAKARKQQTLFQPESWKITGMLAVAEYHFIHYHGIACQTSTNFNCIT
jgi:hypothetical protein